MEEHIVWETDAFRLTVSARGTAESLVLKATGEECLAPDETVSLFTVTQERPFNNEIKLAHPNKRTVMRANRLRREGERLIVGFELAPYSAIVEVKEHPAYLSFRLAGFDVKPEHYEGLAMTPPPVSEFRLLQLPVKHRKNFGEWLNAVHDDRAAVNVSAANPYVRADSELRRDSRVLYAEALRGLKLTGAEAVLIAAEPARLMDALDAFEADYNLPRGVKSRRSGAINHSVYFTADICPANAEEHIARAKQGGFRLMQIYYTSMCREEQGYSLTGDYDWRETYPNGADDLRAVLKKITDAGILPGLHVLQTHIGVKSRYVTPVADHRLHLTRHFTLARPLLAGDTEIFVEEDPEGSERNEYRRVLRFGGEMFSYEDFTTVRPYRFTGVRHGHYGTNIGGSYPAGTIGGQPDISEFGNGTSIYLDQDTSLQDEIADKIAAIYNCGFRFLYFDGSEGVNSPYEIHVPNAQYRVLKKLNEAPLFTEGAAKAHFGWHFLTGGNAFDIFPPKLFKEKLIKHPLAEVPNMQNDFNCLNFGWWGFWTPGSGKELIGNGTQADQYEFGTALAAAYDCPVSVQSDLSAFRRHPRTDDILEVMRRWEDVRARGLLTEEMRNELRDLSREHTLLINESGGYELVPVTRVPCGVNDVAVYLFERNGKRCAVWWHETGSCTMRLNVRAAEVRVFREFGGETDTLPEQECGALLPADGKRYLETELSGEALGRAFAEARIPVPDEKG